MNLDEEMAQIPGAPVAFLTPWGKALLGENEFQDYEDHHSRNNTQFPFISQSPMFLTLILLEGGAHRLRGIQRGLIPQVLKSLKPTASLSPPMLRRRHFFAAKSSPRRHTTPNTLSAPGIKKRPIPQPERNRTYPEQIRTIPSLSH